MTDRYLDDLTVGESWTSEPFTMTEAEIIAFATEFDPQPMHIDKAAAEAGRFGGLIASGWHVCSRVMRQFVDEAYFGQTPLLGMNVDALWWVRPVRPGDTLTVRREIIEIRPSKSQPDRGVVRTKTTVTNQDGDLAMSFENQMQLPRNPEARL
ncbi:MaoC family dehydratase [Brevundimonas diminuta]|uniref:MaoC family dehydratase n=1 Tax=Brevundimonas diminuta TaxID=293 RepID=UPI00209842E3|nr:MaoC family dehydratase [Brevundimonas diminuta]MCO8018531.1 MaoC family dehydratase [Brevundimonas diminuta]MCO8020618.1 MaoC family dehydratase [Brevundimonas diminuta]